MRKIITIILLISTTLSYGQTKKSLLYNESGKLLIDTSLCISKAQLEKWKDIEDSFIYDIISNLKYSQIAKENNLSGLSIISFDLDNSLLLKNFKILKQVGGGLEECLKIAISSFTLLKSLAPDDNSTLTYYVSVDFKLIDAKKIIEKIHTIPISTVNYEYIQ